MKCEFCSKPCGEEWCSMIEEKKEEKKPKKIKKKKIIIPYEELEEEIKSLSLTVGFLIDDVKYLLSPVQGEMRRIEISKYVRDLEEFFKESKLNYDSKN
jgi:hypothetical protein